MSYTHVGVDPKIKEWLEKIKRKHNLKNFNEVFILLKAAYDTEYKNPKEVIANELYNMHTKHEHNLDKEDSSILTNFTAVFKAKNPRIRKEILKSMWKGIKPHSPSKQSKKEGKLNQKKQEEKTQ